MTPDLGTLIQVIGMLRKCLWNVQTGAVKIYKLLKMRADR